MALVTESIPLAQVVAGEYDAVFLPGGHGVCVWVGGGGAGCWEA